MILARSFITLLGIIALQSTGRANLLEANDEQTCMDLCKKCEGKAIFIDNTCQCHIADDNQQGAECINRIKRQARELGLDVVSCDLADPDADRAARCIVSPFRRFRSRSDADLIAKYFMGNSLGGFGSLLGSAKSQTGGTTPGPEDLASSSLTENVGAKMTSSGTNSDTDPALVGASNPLVGTNPMSGQLMDFGPLLGAAATWLHPNTLLAIGNGLQGAQTQGLVGQPNPSSMSTSSSHNYEKDLTHTNFVGSPHQDTDLYSTYPAGTMVGMAPYSYFVGAPNPVQLQDGSQVPPTQSYLYNYNSMVGAQNPSFMGANNMALSPFWKYPTSVVEVNNPQNPDPAAEPESILDESVKANQDLLGEPNPDPSLEAKEDTEVQDKVNELETGNNEIEEPVVSSKQTTKNMKEDVVNPEESKDQTLRSSNHSTKRRQRRLKSKESDAKSETMSENVLPQASSGAE